MTPLEQSKAAREICEAAPVVPVLVVEDAASAADLAKALVSGGLPALEVTLRTPAALDVIAAMADGPGGMVGAGTLLTPDDVVKAKAAGAQFGVAPGATAMTLVPSLAETAANVTMLQRSPTYVVSMPAKDPIAGFLRKVLPEQLAYRLTRWKNVRS